MNWLIELVDWFLPESVRSADEETLRQGRVTVGSSFLFLPVAPISAYFYTTLGFTHVLPPILFSGLVILGSPFLIRLLGSVAIGSTFMLASLTTTLTFVAFETGGVHSPVLHWAFMLPWVAGACLGSRAAIFWTAAGIFDILLVTFEQIQIDWKTFQIIGERQDILMASTLLLVLVTMLAVFLYIDRVRRRSLERLNEVNSAVSSEKERAEKYLQSVATEKQRTESALNRAQVARMELGESNRIKTEVINMVDHDLRGPLNRIIGAAELVKDDCIPADSDAVNFAEIILEAGEKMAEILEGIHALNRLEEGNIDSENRLLNATDLFISSINDYQLRAQNKGITIKTVLEESQPGLFTDSIMLRQIFHQLISNAIKYSPLGGHILASLRLEDDWVVFAIKDTGPGIPEDEAFRLFQPFSRLSTSPTAGESSAGVGLAIVKNLANILGAVVAYETTLDEGTTFYVKLPVSEDSGEWSIPGLPIPKAG